MNFDVEKRTLHFTDKEADRLSCGTELPASDVVGLYFVASNYVLQKQGVIVDLQSTGLQSNRGMIPAVGRELSEAQALADELKTVAKQLYPELFPTEPMQ